MASWWQRWFGATSKVDALPPREAPAETGMNFDTKHLAPFLDRVSARLDHPIGAYDRNSLLRMVMTMPVGATRYALLPVIWRGRHVALRVEIFMDDVEAPDLGFRGPESLIDTIEIELRRFAAEKGI